MNDNAQYPFWGHRRPVPGEWGGRLPIALVFPEKESLGLSTLGWQVPYRLLSGNPDFVVERFFWDAGTEVPVSADSARTLDQFPLICFSLNFEGDFVTLITMLDRAGIAVRSDERLDWPLIMAGGPISFLNPFPILPSLDFVWVGEAEQGFMGHATVLKQAWFGGDSRKAALDRIARLPGVFVPGTTPEPVKRRVAAKTDTVLQAPAYSCFVSSKAEFRDMVLLEVNRGCPYGCRFCAAGFIYRPPRHATMAGLQEIVRRTDPVKVGLVGTALTDWDDLFPFLQWLAERKIKFSLSSLRADGLNRDFLTFLRRQGIRTLTLALEGASARLRTAMNKRFNQEAFLRAVSLASELQFNTLKLYMIVGWPGEGEEDLRELGTLLDRIEEARLAGKGKKAKGLELITLSASCLVPKPWTPMQWAPMASEKRLKAAMQEIRRVVRGRKGFRFSAENPFQARIQGVLSRGDERIHPVLVDVARGAHWRTALKEGGRDMTSDYLDRERHGDERFPWDRLDIGVDKEYLRREWQRYKACTATAACPPEGCARCRRCGMESFWEDEPAG